MPAGQGGGMHGLDVVVFSRTLPPSAKKRVRVVNDDPARVVDTVEVAVIPVLLSEGIPLLPPGGTTKLVLSDHKVLPSGIVALAYSLPAVRERRRRSTM